MQEAETTNTRTKLRPCRTTPQTPKKLGRQAAQTQATPKRRQQANTSTDPWPAYLYQENTSTKQIQIPASAQHAKKTETTRRLKQVQNIDKNLSPKEAHNTRTDTTHKWISVCPTKDKNLSLSNLRQLEGLQTQYTKAEQDQRLPATPVTPPRHRRNGVTTPTPTRRRPACRRKLRSTAAVTSPNTSALGTGTNKHRKHCTRDHANPPKVATLTNPAPKDSELKGRNGAEIKALPTTKITNIYIGNERRRGSRHNNPNSNDISIRPKQIHDRKHLSKTSPTPQYKGDLQLLYSHTLPLHLSPPHTITTLTAAYLPPPNSVSILHIEVARCQYRATQQHQVDRCQCSPRKQYQVARLQISAEKQSQNIGSGSKRVSCRQSAHRTNT